MYTLFMAPRLLRRPVIKDKLISIRPISRAETVMERVNILFSVGSLFITCIGMLYGMISPAWAEDLVYFYMIAGLWFYASVSFGMFDNISCMVTQNLDESQIIFNALSQEKAQWEERKLAMESELNQAKTEAETAHEAARRAIEDERESLILLGRNQGLEINRKVNENIRADHQKRIAQLQNDLSLAEEERDELKQEYSRLKKSMMRDTGL